MKVTISDFNLNDKLSANTFLDLFDFCINDIRQDCEVHLYMKGEDECLLKIDFK